jgi:hypothetical protein
VLFRLLPTLRCYAPDGAFGGCRVGQKQDVYSRSPLDGGRHWCGDRLPVQLTPVAADSAHGFLFLLQTGREPRLANAELQSLQRRRADTADLAVVRWYAHGQAIK